MKSHHTILNMKTFLQIVVILSGLCSIQSSNFNQDFNITWGKDHVKFTRHHRRVQLRLDKESGSGFASKSEYLFGSFNMSIRLMHGDTSGTVTTFYLSSDTGHSRDEVDLEFLGNVLGERYDLQTNIFINGSGYREERIKLWFDPAEDFHNYSILWNHKQILFSIDSIPIRVFRNNEDVGVLYPEHQPMRVMCSIWNGDQWATDGGKRKIDWSKAPFIATYKGFELNACTANSSNPNPPCASPTAHTWWNRPEFQALNEDQLGQLEWVRQTLLTHSYCDYPNAPPECALNPSGVQL